MFAEIEKVPLGSGSIAQVYKARFIGEDDYVAIKVRLLPECAKYRSEKSPTAPQKSSISPAEKYIAPKRALHIYIYIHKYMTHGWRALLKGAT